MRPRNAALILGAAVSLLASCSLLVPGELPAYRCAGTDPSSCPPAMVCDEATQLCVLPEPIDGGDEEDVEDSGDFDGDGGDSGPAEPSDIGGSCVADRDCKAGLLCGTRTILTTAIATGADGTCTTPCCTSADCPPSFVCFSPGTGGNYCVSAELAKRDATGTKTPGQTCNADEECRSGLCKEGHCSDTCCAEADCAAGTSCRVKAVDAPLSSGEMWSCAPPEPGADTEVGESCGAPSCKNNNCSGFPLKCRPSCCSSAECAAQGNGLAICAYGKFVSNNADTKWCFDADPNAPNAPLGEPCSGDLDCESRLCDRETRTCAAACCTDDDCPDAMACRPSPVGPPLLRCAPAEDERP